MSVPAKICGLTCPEDADAAIRAGASALGFNLYPGSKRAIALAAAAPWIARLPALVIRVAVVVNPTEAELDSVLAARCFDAVQFHGDEPPERLEACSRLGPRAFKAIRATSDAAALAARYLRPDGTGTLLLDTFVPGAFGGTGSPVCLDLAAKIRDAYPKAQLVLAGGLTPENVAAAIRTVRPDAVDVAGGVETEGNPRRKDPARLRAFLAAASATI